VLHILQFFVLKSHVASLSAARDFVVCVPDPVDLHVISPADVILDADDDTKGIVQLVAGQVVNVERSGTRCAIDIERHGRLAIELDSKFLVNVVIRGGPCVFVTTSA